MKSFTFFKFLSKGDKTLFDVPVKNQLAFINKLGAPRDDLERSYFQYLSQQVFVAGWKKFVLNFCAIFVIPIIIPVLLLKGLFVKHSNNLDAIGEFKGLEDIVPLCLKENYDINNEAWREGFSLRYSDFFCIWPMIWSYQPYFVLKSLLKVAQYSHSIKLHNPKAFIVHNEYSFTSSLLTAFCERNNLKHINVMHGEKLLYIRDSFFRYHECYVWDKHYVSLFETLKAEPTQFRIAIPPSMSINTQLHINKSVYADYKYYLANNTEKEISEISKKMREIQKKGHSIKVRLHPRYSNIDVIKNYFTESEIEFPKDVNIVESISNLEYAIGSYSTVLVQAYLAGKKVIMDDITLKHQYEKLSSLNYILSQKNNQKLSEI